MDGFGIRPAMWEMGQRLADGGYLVLLPNLITASGIIRDDPSKVLADPKLREELMKSVVSLDRERKLSDAGASSYFCHPFLRSRVDGSGPQVMHGRQCFVDRRRRVPRSICAVASFHAEIGHRSTRQPPSLLRNITAASMSPVPSRTRHSREQKNRLEQLWRKQGWTIGETYPALVHALAVPDVPVFDSDAAERHWAVCLNSFTRRLLVSSGHDFYPGIRDRLSTGSERAFGTTSARSVPAEGILARAPGRAERRRCGSRQ